MCQLLGVSSALPMDASSAFGALAPRGGQTDEHADGFGAAFYHGRSWRLFLDHRPSCSSPLARWIQENPTLSTNVIAHIRKATRGAASLENTHPFSRELWGRQWIFAHNGTLTDFFPAPSGPCAPVGDTDSEMAFCWILQRLRERFESAPDDEQLFEALGPLAQQLSAHGRFNFLLGVGESLFAHCSDRLHWAPLIEESGQRSCLIATVPLAPELEWSALRPGEMVLFRRGALLLRSAPNEPFSTAGAAARAGAPQGVSAADL